MSTRVRTITLPFAAAITLGLTTFLPAGEPPCTSNEDCDDGLFCNGVDFCDVESGMCFPGLTCPVAIEGCLILGGGCDEVNDECTDVLDPSLCPEGQLCAPDGTCVDCLTNEDCDDGLFCSTESCIDGFCGAVTTCPPFINGCVLGGGCDEENDECTAIQDDSLCPEGQLCAPDGSCVDCLTNEDCDDGQFCSTESCIDGFCGAVTTCPPFINGCVLGGGCDEENDECTAIQDDSLCPEGQLCAPDGTCVDCLTDADCDDGLFCTAESCIDGFCGVITTCGPPLQIGCVLANVCDEENDACTSVQDDSLCPEGQLCAPDGSCVDCLTNEDCDDGMFCSTESCMDGSCVAISTCPAAIIGCLIFGECDEENEECVVTQDDSLCPEGQVCAADGSCVAMTCPDDDGDGKVTICHIPPGNPLKARTLSVGVKAARRHLAHGDHCGPCMPSNGG